MSQPRVLSVLIGALLSLSACSSTSEVKQQQYATLKNERTFEHELPVVWKAIETTFKNHKVVERDPEEVGALEWKDLSERSLSTDWIYGQSKDKYQEYRVNDLPRKKYLQTRYRYFITAKRTMGGTHVTVRSDEEIEQLKADGSSTGYSSVEADSQRLNETLEKINLSILSARP